MKNRTFLLLGKLPFLRIRNKVVAEEDVIEYLRQKVCHLVESLHNILWYFLCTIYRHAVCSFKFESLAHVVVKTPIYVILRFVCVQRFLKSLTFPMDSRSNDCSKKTYVFVLLFLKHIVNFLIFLTSYLIEGIRSGIKF